VIVTRRRVFAAALVVAQGFVVTAAASADTKGDLARARAQVTAIEKQANALAQRYEDAYAESARIDDRLRATQTAIANGQQRADNLREVVRQRAVLGYVGGSTQAIPLSFGDSPLDAQRRIEFLSIANEPTARAIDNLRVADEDLTFQRTRLEKARRDQGRVVNTLHGASIALEAKLSEAQHLERDIEARFKRELAAQRRAAAAAVARRAAALRRAAQQRAAASHAEAAHADASSTTNGNTSPAPVIPPPTAGIICPIRGPVSFVDSWGAPRPGGRHHEGVDLMSPFGTPNVAVISGNITERYGNRQGNGIFLYGDDGNTYYYFHLQSYAGPPRHVSQGEVIGYVGDTGDAKGGPSHTHFEYHPGGGGPVDPYPLVRSVC
jgi:murein DD-endopeptidase MepM/ murein hydrolase activator NlpD